MKARAYLAAALGLAALAGIVGSVALGPGDAASQSTGGEVNLYSYRQEFLIRPLLDDFTRETGITVNVQYVKGGILKRMREEGEDGIADAVLTADIATLQRHVEAATFQPVDSATLAANIPARYRHPDGLWFGLTVRARVIVYARDRVETPPASYEDLVDPQWKGRICTRSSGHVYQKSLLASIIHASGEAAALEWAKGVVANLARKPQGNDRAQVKAIWQGVCDIALINTYYLGKMRHNEAEPEQKDWAASIGIVFPNQDGRGAHVNISGAGVARHAKNRDNAVRLIEFLSGEAAQRIFAAGNFEYPVKPGVKWHREVESWGRFKADTADLATVAGLVPKAILIYDRAGFR